MEVWAPTAPMLAIVDLSTQENGCDKPIRLKRFALMDHQWLPATIPPAALALAAALAGGLVGGVGFRGVGGGGARREGAGDRRRDPARRGGIRVAPGMGGVGVGIDA